MSTTAAHHDRQSLQADFRAAARNASPQTLETMRNTLKVFAFGQPGEKASAHEMADRLLAGRITPVAYALEVSNLAASVVPGTDPRAGTGAPISAEKCCVVYMVNGKERRSPWLYSLERGERALAILKARHGRAILFRD